MEGEKRKGELESYFKNPEAWKGHIYMARAILKEWEELGFDMERSVNELLRDFEEEIDEMEGNRPFLISNKK